MSWEGPNNVWDDCWIGEDLLPGVATITGGVSRELDAKKSPGQDGWTIEDKGYSPSDLNLTLRFTARQLDEVRAVLGRLAPGPGKGRGPLTLIHEPSNMLGIVAVQIKNIGIPEVQSGIGRVMITLVQHYSGPAPKAPTSPKKGPGWHFPPQTSSSQYNDILLG